MGSDIPIFNLTQIFQMRDSILDNQLYTGMTDEEVLVGDNFEAIASLLMKKFGLDPSCSPIIVESLRPFLGKRFGLQEAYDLAWRLAGNTDRIRNNLSVLPWHRQLAPEWVPVQVTALRSAKVDWPLPVRRGRRLYLRVLAGTPCPMVISKFFTMGYLSLLASRLGFGRSRSKLHRRHAAELFGLRFLALLEPRLSKHLPGFFHIACPPSLVEYNLQQIRRLRRADWDCPNNFEHQCYECPLGLESCVASTHLYDYNSSLCPGCNKEAWFDPDPSLPASYCIDCQAKLDSGFSLHKETK